MSAILSFLAETWRSTPSPIKTIIIAAFGSLIGAWITGRSQAKRRTIDELKAVRAAYALCFTVTNKALAIKVQHIKGMKERHDNALDGYKQYQANPVGTFQLKLDLQNLSQVSFASDALTRIVLEKTAAGPKALAAAVTLSDSIDDLKLSIDFRNVLVDEFRKNPPATTQDKIARYLGFHDSAGMVDERLKVNIAALFHQVDCCIFFSKTLAEELLKYGNAIRRRNWWRYRLGIPKMLPADWTIAQEANLIPAASDFANWNRGFKKLSRWARIPRRDSSQP
jgi:hypothetical protein